MLMTSSKECERNKAVVVLLPDLLETPEEALVQALFTDDFRLHDAKFPDWPRGYAGALRMFVHMKSMVPDIRATIEDMFGEGDRICVRWRFKGTVTGMIGKHKGDGARFEALMVSIYRFENGRIAEDWGVDIPLPEGHAWRTD
jgi:predicted ester cyclase